MTKHAAARQSKEGVCLRFHCSTEGLLVASVVEKQINAVRVSLFNLFCSCLSQQGSRYAKHLSSIRQDTQRSVFHVPERYLNAFLVRGIKLYQK